MINRKSITIKTLLDQVYGLYQHHKESVDEFISVKDVSSGYTAVTRTRLSDLESQVSKDPEMYVQRVTFGRNCVDIHKFYVVTFPRYWKQTGGFMMFPIQRATMIDTALVFEYDSNQNID